MKKVNLFLILLTASLVAVASLLIIGFLSTPATVENSDWVGNMWGCMNDWVGGGTPQGADSSWVLFGVLLIVFVGLIIISVVGLGYFLVFPQIRPATVNAQKSNLHVAKDSVSAFDSVVKTLSPDESRVLEVLQKHEGKYLQKYIRKEAGLSRLKTHRVLFRLAERGIVVLEKTGNTNQVKLSDWLKQKS